MDDDDSPPPAPVPRTDLPALLPTPEGQSIEVGRGALPPIVPAAPRAMDALGLLRALRRRLLLALTLGLVLALTTGVAAWYLIPPAKVTARSLMLVSSKPPRVIFVTQETEADYRVYQLTQVALVKSHKVLDAALRVPGIAQLPLIREQADPIEWLEREVKVAFPQGSEVLQISISGTRMEEITKIVNAVTEAYQQEIVDEENNERRRRMEKLSRIYEQYQEGLLERRKQLRSLAEQIGSDDKGTITYKHQLAIGRLDDAQAKLMQVQFELKQAQARLAVHGSLADAHPGRGRDPQEATPSAAAAAAIEAALLKEPRIVRDLDEIRKLEEKLKHSVRPARNALSDPTYRHLGVSLQLADKQLERDKAALRPMIEHQYREGGTTGGSVVSSLDRLKVDTLALAALEKDLRKDVERVGKEVGGINQGSMDVERHKDDIEQADRAAKQVGMELESLKVEIDAPPRIRLIDKARLPVGNHRLRQCALAGGAAAGVFGLTLLGVSWWEYRARRIDDVDAVTQALGFRLMGALPALPDRMRHRPNGTASLRDQRWQFLLVESVDATRTMLLHASRAAALQAVMVTSAVKGEGKTSLASHLALSLGRAGRATLLVDCDLRSPKTHRLFDVPLEPGLCEVLRGEVELPEAIQPTSASHVDLLPAGHCDAAALRALALDGLKDLIGALKTQYDFLVVDTAPVLPVADSLQVSQQVDAVVFSILSDVSRVPEVQAAHDRLRSVGAPILGAVVTGTRAHQHYYADYHYAMRNGN